MSISDQFLALVTNIRMEAEYSIRDQLAHKITVGSYNDEGIAAPDEEKGEGFAIFIGEWRIGWFATRAKACDEALKIKHAILEQPIVNSTGSA